MRNPIETRHRESKTVFFKIIKLHFIEADYYYPEMYDTPKTDEVKLKITDSEDSVGSTH